MTADQRSRPTSARRPGGAVAPRATSRPAPSPYSPRSTRDLVLGWGAATGAVLAVIGLNISSLIILVSLGYVATAFLRDPEKRDWRLRQAGWAITILAVLATVFTGALLGYSSDDPTKSEVSAYAYLPMGAATAVLVTILMFALAVAAIWAAKAFGRQGADRYRALNRAAVVMIFYFILLLPGAVATAPALAPLGSASRAPLTFFSIASSILAATLVACAFLWAKDAALSTPGDATHFSFADREYLLFAGAAALFLPRLAGLSTIRWSLLRRAQSETLQEAVIQGAASVATILLPLALSGAATAAFWLSCRERGWQVERWLAVPSSRSALEGAGLARLVLTWRLPLLYGWALVLTAACSFLNWYGFLAAAPAAAHYVLMMTRELARRQVA